VFASFGISAEVIPNIVDLDRFSFRARDPLRPRLVSTRNFDALYNVACTLRAFRLVQERWPEATLTLVGAGPQDAMLRRLTSELDLRQVEFVGRVPPDRIASYYADNDVYVQTPDIDNMPTSVLEAFASGLPVVSTEAGGVPAILTHGVHGLLAPLDDHRAVAGHILTLLEQQECARRLAAAAFDTCGPCTWASVRERWLRAYRGVAAGRRHAQLAAEHDVA
jgi:glycosyltransferase involved in cell wall biosynthesis